MPYGLYMSAAGAQAQNHRMQALSHNLANVNTPGFKPEETILQARFAEMIEQGKVAPDQGGADDIGGGTTIQRSITRMKGGPIKATGRQTDFAINDEESFFVVSRDGEQRLTRAGNFLFNSGGQLINDGGDQVLSTSGNPIRINPTLPFDVTNGGRIQQGPNVFELMLAKPREISDLSRVGDNQFKPLAPFDLVGGRDRAVVAGMLEQSGVTPTGAMMELIETSRAYEANVRMIQNQDHVMGSLISRVLQS
ncbi:MAG: flagellar hook basal-body protein [Planctomycetota bacterium]